MFVFFNYYQYRIVSKLTISSSFVSIRIVSCDDRIVSSLMCTGTRQGGDGWVIHVYWVVVVKGVILWYLVMFSVNLASHIKLF